MATHLNTAVGETIGGTLIDDSHNKQSNQFILGVLNQTQCLTFL